MTTKLHISPTLSLPADGVVKLDTKKLRKLATDATQPGPWSVKHSRSQAQDVYTVLDRDGMWLADVGPAPKDAAFIAACSPEVIVALLDEVDEWSDIANKQHEILEQRLVWPPLQNKCGWCVSAAGGDQAAADSLPTFTLDEVREHIATCPGNPLVRELRATRGKAAKLLNCFICIECGRCAADEDGCCSTCGRDCLAFEDGRLVKTGFVEHIESLERAVTERDALKMELALIKDSATAPAEHDWLACPDCRALSKSGHEPPRCDVFLANEQAASTACDCTPTAHGHLSSCPRYRP